MLANVNSRAKSDELALISEYNIIFMLYFFAPLLYLVKQSSS